MPDGETITVAASARPRSRRGGRLSAYARLSSLKVYFHWIPALIGWTLLADPFGLSASEVGALLLFVAAVVAMTCAGSALDDVQGARDGIDQNTYMHDERLRRLKNKPIVVGELSIGQARAFAIAIGAVGMVTGLVALWIAPHHPWWLLLAWVVLAYAATQYSYGLKISYHSGGEILLGLEASAVLLFPVLFIDGALDATIWLQAYLVGTWFAQVTVFSSSNDAPVDRAAGRLTMAARLSESGNRTYIAAVFALSALVTGVGIAAGALDHWLALALVPTWSLGAAQLVAGLGRGEWLRARFLGWRAFECGLLALVAVNLLAS